MEGEFNQHGGLSLVPMPGFERMAERIRRKIVEIGNEGGRESWSTPVDVAEPKYDHRASGEPFLQLGKRHVGGHDCVIIGSGPGTPEMLLQTMLMLRYLAGRRAQRIALVSGYFPLSRSDKDEGGLEFALPPWIIDVFTASAEGKLDRIISADLHASQVVMSGCTGLITELSMTRRLIKRAVEDSLGTGLPVVVAFPDDGAQKRAGKILDTLEREMNVRLPSVCGVKRRTSSFDSQLLQVFGPTIAIRGAIVLCVDDEITTGGTNIATALSMKGQYGAREVHAVVTHGVFAGNAPERFCAADSPVDRIYCADTVPVISRPALIPLFEAGRLREVSWVNDLAWAIYNHHWNLSIREFVR